MSLGDLPNLTVDTGGWIVRPTSWPGPTSCQCVAHQGPRKKSTDMTRAATRTWAPPAAPSASTATTTSNVAEAAGGGQETAGKELAMTWRKAIRFVLRMTGVVVGLLAAGALATELPADTSVFGKRPATFRDGVR